MSERYRTGDPYPPWDYPRDGIHWSAWQEPWFQLHCPLLYRFHVWLEKMGWDE